MRLMSMHGFDFRLKSFLNTFNDINLLSKYLAKIEVALFVKLVGILLFLKFQIQLFTRKAFAQRIDV